MLSVGTCELSWVTDSSARTKNSPLPHALLSLRKHEKFHTLQGALREIWRYRLSVLQCTVELGEYRRDKVVEYASSALWNAEHSFTQETSGIG
jgi:hypothetical protein